MTQTNAGNQGGWNFHFDEDLLSIGSGKLDIDSYREETVASSRPPFELPLRLCAVPPEIGGALGGIQVMRIFDIYEDEAAGLASFAGSGA